MSRKRNDPVGGGVEGNTVFSKNAAFIAQTGAAAKPRNNAAATDDASDADREWFAAHPGRNYFLRPIAASELASDEQRKPPDGSGLIAYAIVKQFRPGLRLRVFFLSPPFHRIENFSDAACETIWLVVQEQYRQMPDVIDALSKGGAS